MPERFSPSVLIDGKIITPPGWMWVFALAMNGAEWAIIEVEKPEFKEIVKKYLKDERDYHMNKQIKYYEDKIAELKRNHGY